MGGRDVIGLAQTGTGKTAAFALPLLSRVDLSLRVPQLLVLAPTRELAIQVAEAMQSYAKFLPGFHVLPIYGGQSMGLQLKQLQRGVQVVVGTPGRIQDHLRRKTLRLDQLQAVVLDEADEMLRMGFIDAVEDILQHTPDGQLSGRRQHQQLWHAQTEIHPAQKRQGESCRRACTSLRQADDIPPPQQRRDTLRLNGRWLFVADFCHRLLDRFSKGKINKAKTGLLRHKHT